MLALKCGFLLFLPKKNLNNYFLPEVVKSSGIDLLSKHVSNGGICHNISVQKSQTQSQQSVVVTQV